MNSNPQNDPQQFEMPTGPTNGALPRRRAAKVGAHEVVPPPEYPARAKKDFDIGSTFNIDLGFEKDQNGKEILVGGKKQKKVRTVAGYAERTEWVPTIDPTFVFPEEETKIVLMAMENRDNLLVHGHTGVGKTSIIKQVCARLNIQLVRINLDSGITRSELIGDWLARNGETHWMWGVLPLAARMPGTCILLDEWDSIDGGTAFVLQRPLERDDRNVLVMETGGTLIPVHEDNIFVATANTRGLGDETGLYGAGTKVQNFAQLNRFQLTIQLTWMPKKKEEEILKNKFKDLRKHELDSIMHATELIRKAFENNEISVPLSPRDVINWAEKFVHIGNGVRSAKYCFLNRMPPADAVIVEQLIQRSFQ